MIEEQRRRAFLGAMQITSWLPRQPLPFAAPSRPELLETPPREEPAVPVRARAAIDAPQARVPQWPGRATCRWLARRLLNRSQCPWHRLSVRP
ncbi:energy transducer TonB, partial [Pseudomonas aeruginosa]|nr:energy transducer TonB [Pseudomonas aeruginosa]